jgi:DNA repair exonuclease SbcCD ATPase subunit
MSEGQAQTIDTSALRERLAEFIVKTETLSQENTSLRSILDLQKEESNAQLTKLNDEKNELASQLNLEQQQTNALRAQIEQLEAQQSAGKRSDQEREQLKADVTHWKGVSEGQETELSTLREKVATLEKELEAVKEKERENAAAAKPQPQAEPASTVSAADFENLVKENESLKVQLNEVGATLDKQLDALQKKLQEEQDAHATKTEQLNAELSTAHALCAAQKNTISTKEKEIASLNDRVNQLQSKVASQAEEIETLKLQRSKEEAARSSGRADGATPSASVREGGEQPQNDQQLNGKKSATDGDNNEGTLLDLAQRIAVLESLLEETALSSGREIMRLEEDLRSMETLYFQAIRKAILLPSTLLSAAPSGAGGATAAAGSAAVDDPNAKLVDGHARMSHHSSVSMQEIKRAHKLLEVKQQEVEQRIAQLAYDEENLCVHQARLKGKEQKLSDWSTRLNQESVSFGETVKQIEQQLLTREKAVMEREEALATKESSLKESQKEFERFKTVKEEEILQQRSRLAKEEEKLLQQMAVLSEASSSVPPPMMTNGSTTNNDPHVHDSAANKLAQLDTQISQFDRQIHSLHVKRVAAAGQRQFLLSRVGKDSNSSSGLTKKALLGGGADSR